MNKMAWVYTAFLASRNEVKSTHLVALIVRNLMSFQSLLLSKIEIKTLIEYNISFRKLVKTISISLMELYMSPGTFDRKDGVTAT